MSVQFEPSELAIIKERKLERTIILERDVPSDVDADKHESRGVAKVVGTALLKGRDANHFHLTIGKLMAGPDTYFVETPSEAKNYEAALRDALPNLKGYIIDNEGVEQKSDSFEL